MPNTANLSQVESVSYLEQIARMVNRVDQLAEKLNFTMISAAEKETNQEAKDTSLRTALVELESCIDDLLDRTRY